MKCLYTSYLFEWNQQLSYDGNIRSRYQRWGRIYSPFANTWYHHYCNVSFVHVIIIIFPMTSTVFSLVCGSPPQNVRGCYILPVAGMAVFLWTVDLEVGHRNNHDAAVNVPSTRHVARGVTGRRIDPSWWIHWASSRSSQCYTTWVTKAVVWTILYVGWCI